MLLPALVCLATTLVALIYMKWLAPDLGLIERPHGHRTHDLPTPVVGGIGMATGIFVTWMAAGMSEPGMPVALGAFGLVVIGLWDDRHGLPARRKFAAQAAVVAIAVFFDGDLLRTLGPLLPGVDVRLGALALPFTVFAVLGLINAVNMIDGLDGLAGKVMLSAFGWLATCMWMVGGMARLTSNLAIIGAIFAFLLFNARFPGRPRALLFMGDTGSMLLGYLLAIAAIDATQRAPGIPPVTALWICALPILDTLSVTVQRIRDGRPPMAAGRDHLHHLLRAHGLSVGKAVLAEAAIAASTGLAGVAGWRLGVADWIMFASFVGVGLAWHQASRIGWRRMQARETAIVTVTETATVAAAAAVPVTETLAAPVADPTIASFEDPPTIPMPVPAVAAPDRARAARRAEPVRSESSV